MPSSCGCFQCSCITSTAGYAINSLSIGTTSSLLDPCKGCQVVFTIGAPQFCRGLLCPLFQLLKFVVVLLLFWLHTLKYLCGGGGGGGGTLHTACSWLVGEGARKIFKGPPTPPPTPTPLLQRLCCWCTKLTLHLVWRPVATEHVNKSP